MNRNQFASQPVLKPRQPKDLASGTFEYIWPSAIPEVYKSSLAPNQQQSVRMRTKNRNTLKFLEETQKYISRIRNPELSNDFSCHLTCKKKPRLPQLPEAGPGQCSSCRSLLSTKLGNFHKNLASQRRQVLNEHSAQVPGFPSHSSTKSCSIITLSFKKETRLPVLH